MPKKLYGCFDILVLIFIGIIIFNLFFKQSSPVDISDKVIQNEQWQEAITSSRPIFLYFYGDYCGACRQMKPLAYQVADEFKHQYTFVTVDVTDSDNNDLAGTFEVRRIPSMFLVDPIYKNNVKLKLNYDIDYLRKELTDFKNSI